MQIATVNILGTDYTVFEETTNKVFHDDGFDGFCRPYSKEILLKDKDSLLKGHNEKYKEERYNEVLRHELIHAFCSESGVSYDNDEALVDWIAKMIPKLNKAFDSVMEQRYYLEHEDDTQGSQYHDLPEIEDILSGNHFKSINIDKANTVIEEKLKERSCDTCKFFSENKNCMANSYNDTSNVWCSLYSENNTYSCDKCTYCKVYGRGDLFCENKDSNNYNKLVHIGDSCNEFEAK